MICHSYRVRQDLIDSLQCEILDYAVCLRPPDQIINWCSKWQNFEFSADQRIVFLNDDVDYYVNRFAPGFCNYNFLKCCQYFNIATDHVLYITTHIGIHKEIFDLCDLLNLPHPTVIETHNFSRMMPYHGIRDMDYNDHLIDRPYVFAAGIQRHHRVMMLSYLKHENLLDQGHISFHFDYADLRSTMPDSQGLDHGPIMRSTVPWQGINEEFAMTQQDHDVWSNHAGEFVGKRRTMCFDEVEFDKIKALREHQPNFIQHGLVNLISETYFDFPYPALSEKTFKSIWCKRAFIILGAKNSLRTLHDLGFRTFDDLWDESYDQEADPMKRLKKVLFLVKLLCDMDESRMRDLAEQARRVTEHNYQHYLDFHMNNFTARRY